MILSLASPTPSLADNTLLLNEIMAQPGDEKEWVEIYNPTEIDIDLTGWKIEDEASSNTDITLTGTIKGKEIIVFEHIKGWLNDDGDIVRLIDNTGQVIDTYQYERASEKITFARSPDGWLSKQDPSKGLPNPIPTPTLTPTNIPSPTSTPEPTATETPTPTPSTTSTKLSTSPLRASKTPTPTPIKSAPTKTPTPEPENDQETSPSSSSSNLIPKSLLASSATVAGTATKENEPDNTSPLKKVLIFSGAALTILGLILLLSFLKPGLFNFSRSKQV